MAVEPAGSPVLSEGRAGAHKIQGIGAGFVPSTLDTDVYDEVITVSDEDAYEEARRLARTEGITGGRTAGAALRASSLIAQRDAAERRDFGWREGCESRSFDRNIVVILPDSGDRYLTTELFL